MATVSVQQADPAVGGPVFVFGTLRSSSTLLALAMSMHPHFQLAGDTRFLRRLVIGLRQSYDASLEPRDVSHMRSREVEIEDFLGTFGQATSTLLAPRPSIAPGVDNAAVRWIDATHDNVTIALPLLRMFPDARFIIVTRPVTEVVAELMSHEKRSAYRTRAELCDIPWAAKHWADITEAMLRAERAFGSQTVMRISRDAFVADLAGTIERALGFAGDAMHPACLVPIHGMAEAVTPSLSMDLEEILADIDDPDLAERVRRLNDAVITPTPVESYGDLAVEIELELEYTNLARSTMLVPAEEAPSRVETGAVTGGIGGFVRRFRSEFTREYKRALAARREATPSGS